MQYTISKAWLGLFNLTLWTLIACLGLFNEWPSKLFPAEESSLFMEIQWWTLIVLAYICIMLPLDILGGFIIPKLTNYRKESFPKFWKRLSRGIMLHAAILWISGPLIMEIGKYYGILGVMALLMSTSTLMLMLQNPLARIVAGYKIYG